MTEEIETCITTEDGVRLYICEWDDGGAWLRISGDRASMNAVLTRAEAQQMLDGLLAILNKPEAA